MLQPGDDVQSGFRNLQSETVTKQLIELFDEEISSLGIDFPHPLDVTEEKTLGDKTRQRRLVDWRRVLISCRSLATKGVVARQNGTPRRSRLRK